MVQQSVMVDHFQLQTHRDDQKLLAALEGVVVPALLARITSGDSLRIWLPDCGDGEIAYLLAVIIGRSIELNGRRPTIQIFATDSDAQAITKARRRTSFGRFAAANPGEPDEPTVDEGAPVVLHKEQRDWITFAQHFVLSDPPFAHLDLIICRHLLSTLSDDEQEQITHEFHWCLRSGGYLLIGPHEYSFHLTQLFIRQDTAPGLFQRREVPSLRLRLPNHTRPASWQENQPAQFEASEHLQTMNHVLRQKVSELTQANNDLTNLIAATDLAIIFLDRLLQIMRFTPTAAALFNLLVTDRGRPLAHIQHMLKYDDLLDDAASVLKTLLPSEREVPSEDGRWFLARIRPYRTIDERISGVILVCVDITARRTAEFELRRARDELEVRVLERTQELHTANTQLQVEIAERARLEQERTELLRRIVMTQEDERRRIARELHDQLGQSLSELNVGLSILANPGVANEQREQTLARLRQVVTEIDHDMDRLALDLRPSALDDIGLPQAIQQHVEQWAEHSGIHAEFQHVAHVAQRLDPTVESVIFRVIQEALTNILKHAAACHVSVILEQRRSELLVIVEDDGSGFDLEALQTTPHRGRLGLVGMRERVMLVGGWLHFETAPGAGTSLFVHIPISPQ